MSEKADILHVLVIVIEIFVCHVIDETNCVTRTPPPGSGGGGGGGGGQIRPLTPGFYRYLKNKCRHRRETDSVLSGINLTSFTEVSEKSIYNFPDNCVVEASCHSTRHFGSKMANAPRFLECTVLK